jgi:O-antigen/teichoic acid export membrane protein
MKGFVSNIYIKNFSWLLIEKIIRIFSGVLVGASVARYLAPEQFGLFNYALSFASMFTAFSTLGLDGLVVRELVKNNYTRDAILGTAFFLRLFGAFTVVFLVLLSMMIISLEYNTKILILIITCATIFQSFNVVDLFFQSQTLSKPVVIVNIITLLISSIIKIGCIFFKMPLITFAWIVLFESIFLSLLKDSFFYMISATIISFYMKIDQVMIGNILGPKYVGEYAVAAKLSELWYFIPIIISQSIFPSLEKTKIISKKLFYDKLEKLFVVGYLTSIFIVLSTILLSKFVIITLYGIAYSNAVVVLIIHITSLVFVFQRVATEYWILSENLKYFEIIKTFISLIINVLLNIFLIKKYGISGAAISTVITLFFSGYLSFAFYKKAHPVFQIMTRTLLFQNLKILKIKK